MSESPFVYNVNSESFSRVVLENSYQVPVLVDFWADWCAPCGMLMPILAKLANEFAGRFILAKLNTEEEKMLAAQYQIRSLPTVKLFRNGEVMDEFMGALPESAIREFLDRYIERESDRIRQEALTAHQNNDSDRAIELLREALEKDQDNYRVHRDLIRLLLDTRKYQEADELLRSLPANHKTRAEFQELAHQAQFAAIADGAPPVAELMQAIETNPSDSEARYQLSAIKVLSGDYAAALEQLLEIMRCDRAFRDDAARKGMLGIFQLLGGKGPLVSRYRGLMSSTLY